ncbi:MAG: sulfite exporter TauE/SafE family protein, partial [Methylococcaceae bacterium]|nr:sulfite exporter TauE/SafE family protein [Methylococcaceae bacterium]
LSLKAEVRNNKARLFQFILNYNMGRIFSYTLAGGLAGLAQTLITLPFAEDFGYRILQLFSALIMMSAGLYIAGWFPRFAYIEKAGSKFWKFIEPFGRKLIPISTHTQAYLFGMVWGWLPCGLVYYVLLVSPAKDGALNSAFFMLAFGLGTLIPMMAAGFLTGRLAPLRQSQIIRHFSGSVLVIMGVISLFLAIDPDAHQYLRFHVF